MSQADGNGAATPAGSRPLGTVLVSGGASGLGAAVVDAVAAAGGRPVVLDLNPPGDAVDHEIVDLSSGADAEAAAERIAERHGGLDGVVTAAGTDACGRIDQVDRELWERVIGVNLLGTAALVRAALPHLERVNGTV